MRRSLRRLAPALAAVPKPLVPIRGVPLLERNLVALLRAGAREIAVAVPAARPEIERFVGARGGEVARATGARIVCLREERPLGSAGAVAALRDRDAAVLVVNADNLSSLDLADLVQDHLRSGAALTIALHEEPFLMPFGQLSVEAGRRVVGYLEKPRWSFPIASGAYVLSPEAIRAVAPGEALAMDALVARLLDAGAPVRAYPHAAPWVDVNDGAAADRAEAMVAAHPELFERWSCAPDAEEALALLQTAEGVAVQRPRAGGGPWRAPGVAVRAGESPARTLAAALRHRTGGDPPGVRALAVFDEIAATGTLVRHHVFVAAIAAARLAPAPGHELGWLPLDDLGAQRVERPLRRALCALEDDR
jgi:dTDP-glucose pyrophosphorylase/ADP-ribose pyrophosphatase YjhB (NUDIX family)